MKVLKVFLITILAIVIVVVGVLGYFGFMPGISNLFGSNKPKDLGVAFTSADYQSGRAKTGTKFTDLASDAAPEQSVKFSGQKSINATFTQAEATALLNNRLWKYYPLTDCQVRINQNGTVEVSGVLIKSRLEPMAKALGVSDSEIGTVTSYVKYLPGNPAFYVRGQVAVTNGRVSIANLEEFQVGRLNFTSQIQDNQNTIINWIQNEMFTLPGVSIKTFKMVNGQVQFEGTLPDAARSK